MKKLTIKQALENGYTHWATKDGESNHRIDKIQMEYFPEEPIYLVDKESGYQFTISAKSIEEWVIETLIGEQDEVSDPNGKLSELASEANFDALAKDINDRMSKMTFFDLTDIELIP